VLVDHGAVKWAGCGHGCAPGGWEGTRAPAVARRAACGAGGR
jgi:hypothetical protein